MVGRSVDGILRATGFEAGRATGFTAGRPFGMSSFHGCSSSIKTTQDVSYVLANIDIKKKLI
jgi:hypothetical protein